MLWVVNVVCDLGVVVDILHHWICCHYAVV